MTCPMCKGTGQLQMLGRNGQMTTCNHCLGQGAVQPRRVDCMCNDGADERGNTCHICHGTGIRCLG